MMTASARLAVILANASFSWSTRASTGGISMPICLPPCPPRAAPSEGWGEANRQPRLIRGMSFWSNSTRFGYNSMSAQSKGVRFRVPRQTGDEALI